jgi:hypothetical protein
VRTQRPNAFALSRTIIMAALVALPGWADANPGCSGQAKGYPAGWVFKAVYHHMAGTYPQCNALLFAPNNVLDEDLGIADCEKLCKDNIGPASPSGNGGDDGGGGSGGGRITGPPVIIKNKPTYD